jgi:hypothetical protein
MKTTAIALLSGLMAACATQSHVPAGADALVDVKGNGVARAAGGPVIAAAAVGVQTAQGSDVVSQKYLKSGYRVVHENGQLLYCRSEAITGTLLRSTVCKTDAQLKAAEQMRQNVVDELGKPHGGECQILKCN